MYKRQLLRVEILHSREVQQVVEPPKKTIEGAIINALDSCLFASISLKLGNTDLGCKYRTAISRDFYVLPKRLRASA